VWKDLTDNVNQLAANLTNQVRAISDVATAVTEGDLTRQVGVEASGEVAVLKDKLNEMIRNLRETTRENTEQDWLKTNLERFTRMLQGQRDLATVSRMILSELAPLLSAQHGVFYTLVKLEDGDEPVLQYQAGYGYRERKHLANQFHLGEGLVGQCAREKERILLTDVPGDYVTINSGLGDSPPLNIIVLPILFEGSVRAVVELASFSPFSVAHQEFLDQLTESIGLVLNTIEANTLTENLLRQSQSQSQELRSRQEDLRSSNEDLAKQAARLAEQNTEMEAKNREVELAKRLVEEKAEQLAVSSAFKSEFFSNMSHELRTPLNSLLILASELKANPERNLTDAQVQYASIIQSSGSDLLRLLNDVLDLAKVESGTVVLEIGELPLVDLQYALQREFGPLADHKGLSFSVELAPGIPGTIATDSGRLRQVLKNLLANAFKFTERGTVTLRISRPEPGWKAANHELGRASGVTAFSISDSGIGIAPELQQRIFDAFAQGDGTTARKYGGTGLGLSISSQLVQLLGGEMALTSTLGEGSTFTVSLPSAADADALTVIPEGAPASAPPAPRARVAEMLAPQPLPASAPEAALLQPTWPSAPELVAPPLRLQPPLPPQPQLRPQPEAQPQPPLPPQPEAQPQPPLPPHPEAQPQPQPQLQPLLQPRGPVAATPNPVPARRRPHRPAGAGILAGKKVLVVDDDFRNIFAITVLLERGDLTVISAESGGEGISALERMPDIDIVLVDIMMPIMNGYDTMRAMRELPGLGRLPIIALTAKTGGGERERCIEAGASAYIPKPVENGPDFLLTLGDVLAAAIATGSSSEVMG